MKGIGQVMLQRNAQGLNSAKEDVVKLIDDLKPNIIALQETFQGEKYITNFVGYNEIALDGHHNRGYFIGVALYIHNSLPYQ